MVANASHIADAQTGSVTRRRFNLAFYRGTVVASPTQQSVDPSDQETRAIENDQVLFSTVVRRLSAPSFVSMEDALKLQASE
ncbi:MAG: hypothetical protein M3P18_09540 [Actinomycetota bacterium]|nr:hypothetical protein [Actinomycetota bacterium]